MVFETGETCRARFARQGEKVKAHISLKTEGAGNCANGKKFSSSR
jgi:hypothetical protein